VYSVLLVSVSRACSDHAYCALTDYTSEVIAPADPICPLGGVWWASFWA
jgi:hypothetical protein